MELHIRPARPEDAAIVSQLAFRAKSSWGYPEDWLELWRPALTITSDYLGAHKSLVALQGQDVVGVAILELRGEKASLEHLWIAPEHQGRGIGRALLERALDIAAIAGLARVEVEADPSAAAFYLRLGARQLGVVPAPMPGAPGRTLPLLEFPLGTTP